MTFSVITNHSSLSTPLIAQEHEGAATSSKARSCALSALGGATTGASKSYFPDSWKVSNRCGEMLEDSATMASSLSRMFPYISQVLEMPCEDIKGFNQESKYLTLRLPESEMVIDLADWLIKPEFKQEGHEAFCRNVEALRSYLYADKALNSKWPTSLNIATLKVCHDFKDLADMGSYAHKALETVARSHYKALLEFLIGPDGIIQKGVGGRDLKDLDFSATLNHVIELREKFFKALGVLISETDSRLQNPHLTASQHKQLQDLHSSLSYHQALFSYEFTDEKKAHFMSLFRVALAVMIHKRLGQNILTQSAKRALSEPFIDFVRRTSKHPLEDIFCCLQPDIIDRSYIDGNHLEVHFTEKLLGLLSNAERRSSFYHPGYAVKKLLICYEMDLEDVLFKMAIQDTVDDKFQAWKTSVMNPKIDPVAGCDITSIIDPRCPSLDEQILNQLKLKVFG